MVPNWARLLENGLFPGIVIKRTIYIMSNIIYSL